MSRICCLVTWTLASVVFSIEVPAQKRDKLDVSAEVKAKRKGFDIKLDRSLDDKSRERAQTAFRFEMLQLILRHGPGGSGPQKDVFPAYEALCSEPAGLVGLEACRLVRRLVLANPSTPAAAILLKVIARDAPDLSAATRAAWILSLANDRRIVSESARALDLLTVRLALGCGQIDAALELATAASRDRSTSTDLRREARKLSRECRSQRRAVAKANTPAARVVNWQQMLAVWDELAPQDWGEEDLAPPVWSAAEALGPEVLWAMMLLGARRGEGPDVAPEIGLEHQHGRLIRAWYDYGRGAGDEPWLGVLEPLANANSTPCLELVDALYELRLQGDAIREQLEQLTVKTRKWQALSMALRALAFQATLEQPRTLAKHRSHKSWQVRLALAEALRAYRHTQSAELLVRLLGDKHMRVRHAALQSLVTLTDKDFGPSPKAWRSFLADTDQPVAKHQRGGSWIERKAAAQRTVVSNNYYGVDIPSNRIVLVLDKSDSMFWGLWERRGGGGRAVLVDARADPRSSGWSSSTPSLAHGRARSFLPTAPTSSRRSTTCAGRNPTGRPTSPTP